jgi:hypothetical protein
VPLPHIVISCAPAILASGAVEIGRHGGNEVAAILPAIGFAELDARDLRDRIGRVGRLQRSGEQRLLADRLIGEFGIDAGRTEEQQLFDAGDMGGMDDIRLQDQVLIQEVGGISLVGKDAAHLRSRKEDRVRPVLLHPGFHVRLSRQVEFAVRRGQDFAILRDEPTHQCRPDHAPMSGDEDAFSGEPVMSVMHEPYLCRNASSAQLRP